MSEHSCPSPLRITLVPTLLAALVLTGCSAVDRIQQIGETPKLTQIQNPNDAPGYRPVSMPMPPPLVAERQPNSLWRAGSRSFFKDLRASRVGDIVTVVVSLNEQGRLTNDTRRTRTGSDTAGIGNLFGLQTYLNDIFPEAINNTTNNATAGGILDLTSDSAHRGQGQTARTERIETRLAAVVTQVLPNGNLVLQGRQEVRVNYEVRELALAGVIRPEDISPRNTISLDQIAEARVSYGGRGHLTDIQQPRYGSQLLDIIMPF